MRQDIEVREIAKGNERRNMPRASIGEEREEPMPPGGVLAFKKVARLLEPPQAHPVE